MTSISLTSSNTSSIPAKKNKAIFQTLKKWSKQAAQKSNPFSKGSTKADLIYPFYHLEGETCNNTLAQKNYSHSMINTVYKTPTLMAMDPERNLPLPELSPSQESNISPNSISSSSPKESFMYLESDIHTNAYDEEEGEACEFRRLSFGDLPITPNQVNTDSSAASIKSSRLADSLLTNTLKRNSLISQTSSGFESSNLSDDESDIQCESLQDYITAPQASTKFGHELISKVLTMAINNNPEELLTNFDISNPLQNQQKGKKKNKKKLTLRNSAISKSIPLPIPNVAYPTSPVSKSYKSKLTRPNLTSGRFRGSFSTKSLYDPNFNIQSLASYGQKTDHTPKLSTQILSTSTKSTNQSLIASLQDSKPFQTPYKRFNHLEDTSDIMHYQAQHTFWLVKQFKKTISSGGYLTKKLFIPAEVWRQEPSPLKNIDQKIQYLQNLSYQLVFMEQLDKLDFCKVSDFIISLNIQLTSNNGSNQGSGVSGNGGNSGSGIDSFRLSIIQPSSSQSSSNSKSKKSKQKFIMPQSPQVTSSTTSEGTQMKRYRQELLQFLNACHTLETLYNYYQNLSNSEQSGGQLGLNPIRFLNNSTQLLNLYLVRIIREDLLNLLKEYLERYRDDIDH
ncbi:hypothetical protein CONCODRAFT_13637 [Conidiobolus coronatus NRRL 28638]|uniref:Uncharacterized protein n=1 Tax=Conidiobolus coronatus (strain ATCC 28846 / CBS 209.66 / NRRL 28638) TaxID=796925 RepID=A0A137NQB9_CONC2|nr:hypothetical protein CONCODRAFT_13637 [Conidiobolus coronatus NRRL 28638]|eukprot:KXN64956.1 hypothetical protein CONCODRAFT_13637 [Conidiobolus coronatus NRRL 28638]